MFCIFLTNILVLLKKNHYIFTLKIINYNFLNSEKQFVLRVYKCQTKFTEFLLILFKKNSKCSINFIYNFMLMIFLFNQKKKFLIISAKPFLIF